MNTFNSLFHVVKRHCDESGLIEDKDCFKSIAREAEIPLSRLDFYLSALRDLGLLHYSSELGIIKLTKLGRGQDKVFSG